MATALSEPAAPPTTPERELESVDVARLVRAHDPRYLGGDLLAEADRARVTELCHAGAEGRLYLVLAGAWLFWSDDCLRSLHAVTEVNHGPWGPLDASQQSIDAVVETVEGSVLAVGRRREQGEELGVVWRKRRGGRAFHRAVATRPAWRTSPGSGRLAAGLFGREQARMVVVPTYAETGAAFHYSLDDGLTWRRQGMEDTFAGHVHEAWLPPAVDPARTARLWVTGGDDPTGARSGLVCFDALGPDGSLGGLRWVLRETPGYRLVGLHGDGRHVFVGNESLCGGALKIQDNLESIERRDFEYILGKTRHDYHQFRALVATADGALVAGSSSYRAACDGVRADSGGTLYVSNDQGASFRQIPLGDSWVSNLVHDGAGFWIATTSSHPASPDVSRRRLQLLRLRRPSPWAQLREPYVAKVLVADSSRFYEQAGYPAPPRPSLAPGERTFRVDLAAWGSIALQAETLGPGTLAVEALAFETWRLDESPWRDVAMLRFDGPGQMEVVLGDGARHNRWFRLRNAGPEAIAIRYLAFLGREA